MKMYLRDSLAVRRQFSDTFHYSFSLYIFSLLFFFILLQNLIQYPTTTGVHLFVALCAFEKSFQNFQKFKKFSLMLLIHLYILPICCCWLYTIFSVLFYCLVVHSRNVSLYLFSELPDNGICSHHENLYIQCWRV